jgi:uncharacterized membrane protein YhaH (DUF805 family)
MSWFVYCLKHYAKFSGRAGRPEYWWMYWVSVGIGVLLYLLSALSPVFNWLNWLTTVAFFIPSLAVAARRLHDTGRSLWWFGAWNLALIPLIAMAFYAKTYMPDPLSSPGLVRFVVLYLLAWLVLALWITYLLCKRGDAGANRYGEPGPLTPS